MATIAGTVGWIWCSSLVACWCTNLDWPLPPPAALPSCHQGVPALSSVQPMQVIRTYFPPKVATIAPRQKSCHRQKCHRQFNHSGHLQEDLLDCNGKKVRTFSLLFAHTAIQGYHFKTEMEQSLLVWQQTPQWKPLRSPCRADLLHFYDLEGSLAVHKPSTCGGSRENRQPARHPREMVKSRRGVPRGLWGRGQPLDSAASLHTWAIG